jgi:hypothetical protein
MKTIRVRSTTGAKQTDAPAEDAPEAAPVAAAAQGLPMAAAPAPRGASYTLAAILALLAFLAFAALLALQGLEWSYYHEPPTAFPAAPGTR